MENLDFEVLAGAPFMEMNDIAVHPAKHLITIGDNATILYGSTNTYPPQHSARRARVLRAPATSTVWPDGFLEPQLSDDLPSDTLHPLDPRPTNTKQVSCPRMAWPSPRIASSIAGRIRIPTYPKSRYTSSDTNTSVRSIQYLTLMITRSARQYQQHLPCSLTAVIHLRLATPLMYALNPDHLLSAKHRSKFQSLLTEHDHVFNPYIEGYNGAPRKSFRFDPDGNEEDLPLPVTNHTAADYQEPVHLQEPQDPTPWRSTPTRRSPERFHDYVEY